MEKGQVKTKPSQPLVELWDNQEESYIIVSRPTGVLYTNQVGGTACLQPQLEGYLIPLVVDIWELAKPIVDCVWWWPSSLTPDDVARIERVVLAISEVLNDWDLQFDEEYRDGVAEAWVPVRFRCSAWSPGNVLEGRGVLTYSNSD